MLIGNPEAVAEERMKAQGGNEEMWKMMSKLHVERSNELYEVQHDSDLYIVNVCPMKQGVGRRGNGRIWWQRVALKPGTWETTSSSQTPTRWHTR